MERLEFLKIISTPHRFLTSLLLSVVYNGLIITVGTGNGNGGVLGLILNFVFVYGLSFVLEKLVAKIYKPSFYQKGRMTILDVISRYATSGGKGKPIYEKQDYATRYNFELQIYTTIATFIVYFALIFFGFWMSVLVWGDFRNPLYEINFQNIIPAVLFFISYLIMLYALFVLRLELEKEIEPFTFYLSLCFLLASSLIIFGIILL